MAMFNRNISNIQYVNYIWLVGWNHGCHGCHVFVLVESCWLSPEIRQKWWFLTFLDHPWSLFFFLHVSRALVKQMTPPRLSCKMAARTTGQWPVIGRWFGGDLWHRYVASHDVFKHKAINGYTWHFGAKNSKNQETNQRISWLFWVRFWLQLINPKNFLIIWYILIILIDILYQLLSGFSHQAGVRITDSCLLNSCLRVSGQHKDPGKANWDDFRMELQRYEVIWDYQRSSGNHRYYPNEYLRIEIIKKKRLS